MPKSSREQDGLAQRDLLCLDLASSLRLKLGFSISCQHRISIAPPMQSPCSLATVSRLWLRSQVIIETFGPFVLPAAKTFFSFEQAVIECESV